MLKNKQISIRISFLYYFAILVILIVAFYSSLWELWEQDIFWQIRAGNEFLQTFEFQTRDLWSYTAYGDPWFNYQWLSTIVIATIHNVADVSGLIYFRGILIFLLLIISFKIIRSVSRTNFFLIAISLLPVFYSAIVPRIQIRPEMFVILLNGALVLLWVSLKSYRVKVVASLFLVLLASNFHPGLAPFLMCISIAFSWKGNKHFLNWLIFCIAIFLSFFCHPYAKELPYFLLRHLFYQAHTYLPNIEHLPLSLNDFNISVSSLFAWSWATLTLCGSYLIFQKKYENFLPSSYRNKLFIIPLHLLLTALCFNRPRVIPFQLIFLLPVLSIYFSIIFEKVTSKLKRYIFICLSLSVGALQIFLDKRPLGFQINSPLYPLETVDFIQKHHPQSNILHMPKWGDYLLGAIPEYKVFFDAREIQYDKIQFIAHNMYNSPQMMNEIVEHYGIRTVLLASDFFLMTLKKGDAPWSRREAFFPSSKWAVVSYDNNSFLLLRRIPEHEELIKDFEYHYLIPDIPISFYLKSSSRSKETDIQFLSELNRCRKEHPHLRFCFELN